MTGPDTRPRHSELLRLLRHLLPRAQKTLFVPVGLLARETPSAQTVLLELIPPCARQWLCAGWYALVILSVRPHRTPSIIRAYHPAQSHCLAQGGMCSSGRLTRCDRHKNDRIEPNDPVLQEMPSQAKLKLGSGWHNQTLLFDLMALLARATPSDQTIKFDRAIPSQA